jgi:transcriptional regulator with XRE-family HTH domain
MDAKKFLETEGRDRAKEVAEAAGTNIEYFSQIAHGHRKPSPKLAKRLADASGGEMTIPELMPHIFGLLGDVERPSEKYFEAIASLSLPGRTPNADGESR